mgnify:FL=1|jgi:hypothetical protein
MPTTRSQERTSQSYDTRMLVEFIKFYLESKKEPTNPISQYEPQSENQYIKQKQDSFNPHTKESSKPIITEVYKPTNICRFGSQCCNFECHRIHPANVIQKCELGDKCIIQECDKLHPKTNICKYGNACINYECNRKHPLGTHIKCSVGSKCTDKLCKVSKLHPSDLKK